MAAEANRLGIPVANLGRRFSRTAGASYTAFSCPSCRALFGDWFLRDYIIEARSIDASFFSRFPGDRDRIPASHWCLDSGSGQCVSRCD